MHPKRLIIGKGKISLAANLKKNGPMSYVCMRDLRTKIQQPKR